MNTNPATPVMIPWSLGQERLSIILSTMIPSSIRAMMSGPCARAPRIKQKLES